MLYDYKKISIEHFDCSILFYGRELTPSNYAYSGKNTRDCYVLHYIESGKGSFASAGNPMVQLKAGDVFILPKSIPCFYQADSDDPWTYSWIGLAGNTLKEILLQSQLMNKCYLRSTMNRSFATAFSTLLMSLHEPLNLSNRLLVQGNLLTLFHFLLTEFPAKNLQKKDIAYDQFLRATTLLKNNLEKSYNITDMAATLHLSRSYIYTIFKKFSEYSPQEYLLNLRIDTAKSLLVETDYSLQTIGQLVGYKDPFTFSKAFKRITNQSPQEFRKINN